MLKSLDVTESFTATVPELTGRRMKVRLIEGDKLGSSAYYPADVIRRDGPTIFTKGTPMFLDHQTPEEKALKPFGSIANFVGELAEDAYYDGDGLYADVEVFEDAAPLIKARHAKIGVSVRANIVAEEGVIEGRSVPIAKQFTSARSVDFVMRPGAGGKIVSILESAVEEPQEEAEESGEYMDKEILDAIKALDTKYDARFTSIEESLKAQAVKSADEAPVEESEQVDANAKALEIAEAFTNSTLDAEGRSRVIALHGATGKSIAELIEAEEAYIKAHTVADDEHGVEESADEDHEVEESAKVSAPIPGAWKKD